MVTTVCVCVCVHACVFVKGVKRVGDVAQSANLAGFKSKSVTSKINKQPVQGVENWDDMISTFGSR